MKSHDKFCVGAYAASPSANGFDRAIEERYYAGIREFGFVEGLEIPFQGALHPVDTSWFLDQLSPDWNSTITPIPGVMGKLGVDPVFGLASENDDGRKRALDFMKALHDGVSTLNRHFGKQVVTAVEVHSAPTLGPKGVGSSIEKLALSLCELRSWDWQGAHLCVEHCDRYVPDQVPAKGFLSLADEMAAIGASSGATPIGVLINWGRSAIEGRSATLPESHIATAKDAGLLKGLIFSGATVDSSLYGTWSDSHAPFETSGSVLTRERIRACVEKAGIQDLRVFGFKMQALPKSLDVLARLDFLKANATQLANVILAQEE